jgi:predicted Zn-dependent protease with MMP-like domain
MVKPRRPAPERPAKAGPAAVAPRTLSRALREALRHLVDEAMEFLARGELDRARLSIGEALHIDAEHPEVLALRGELAWLEGDVAAGRALVERSVAAEPNHADHRHILGRMCEETGDFPAMVEHDLAVLRLDAAADRRAGIGRAADLAFIEDHARRVLEALPDELAERLRGVPVVLEPRPAEDVVREGFDPRALGLFEGPDDLARRSNAVHARPTRIVLFYANLLATCRGDAELAEEVEVTILHEIGHFFGLDEDGVADLGLE